MHENKTWSTRDSKIINTKNDTELKKPSVIVDMDTGTVIDIGEEAEMEWVFNDQKTDKPKAILIYFRNFHTEEDADGICTLLNRMSDNIGWVKMLTLVSMLGHEKLIKTEIKQLQQKGY